MTFNARRFLDRGYDFIECDVGGLPTSIVMDGLARFLEQPQEARDRWSFPVLGYWDTDPGYHRKDGSMDPEIGVQSDQKEHFHWTEGLYRAMRFHRGGMERECYRWREWLEAQEAIHRVMKQNHARMAAALDEVLGGNTLTNRLDVDSVLRSMRYDAGRPGKEHADKTGITQHVFTSHPGYRLRGEPIETPPGQMLVFGGRKLAFLLNRPHLAVQHEAKAYIDASGETRKVIVFFGNLRVPALVRPDQARYKMAA